MTTEFSDDLLTARDVARILSCSVSLVYALARNGSLPCVRFGGIVRFRRSDITAVISADRDKE